MRVIKFRVWDNVGYMSNPFTLQDIIMGAIEFTIDCPVMQFTGLTDKNGKGIYEGDIIKTSHNRKFPVEFHNGCFTWDNEPLYYDFDTRDLIEDTAIVSITKTENWAEVIGNIYENPELIKS